MNNKYLTIKDDGEHETIIDKSRFICHIARVNSDKEAHAFIQKIKKIHYNATHNCSCYIIGIESNLQKAHDDGEPSGTAGIPMLEVLRKNCLTDTVCVVTRYFGGIKLGAGGLIRAYSGAVSETIKQIGIIERKRMQVITITADYTHIGILDSRLANYEIMNKIYLEKVFYDVIVDVEKSDEFISWLIDLTNKKVSLTKRDIIMKEVDYIK
ncbi:MAG: family er yvyE [Haloplasmataceae bacterium]|jgi:uncharacterized YigZ family protein|nr:family er yvyE [Haloplasmataceae bacterium]